VTVQVIKVPDIGEGIAQVELVAWHVKPGDPIAEDQAIADVMTDKATVEIPSPVAGQVIELGGEVGQMLSVGAALVRIERGSTGDAASASAATRAAATPVAAKPSAPVAAKPPAAAKPTATAAPPSAVAATAAPPSAVAADPQPGRVTSRGRPIASPAVRARAWELGVDLNDVPAHGPAGRIMKSDLEAYAARVASRPAGAPPAAARPAAASVARQEATHETRVVGLRRMIAQRMQESKRRIPHYTYVEEVDVTEVEALRSQLNGRWSEQRGHLTLLPFLVQALVQAVREFQQINSRFDDDAGVLTRFDAVHVGIATQTDAGLLVPVLRDAHARDLWSCAAEIARLAVAARAGAATRGELTGSTITITSLGRLGGIVSTPVINYPEVAIVGVNRIATRPTFVGDAIVPRQVMNLSSSFDHRVIDGAVAAGFIQCVRGLLEQPATMFIA